MSGRAVDLDAMERGVVAGDRAWLARAITLIESSAPAHQDAGGALLTRLMARTGGAVRVGITGVPGVGKSTFIERLGTMLTGRGHRVAVLAVDPSSGISGGSILGDKTRMERLSADPNAYIRPSPSAGSLGGVAARTRETMLLCEAAGFDVVLVETVGVGQSETAVAEMTDFFVALMMPGAGDELQGIKRGLLELADMVVVNKADGEQLAEAKRAASEYQGAVRMTHAGDDSWRVPVLLCSARTGAGIEELWDRLSARVESLRVDGRLEERRREQMLRWMWSSIEDRLRHVARSGSCANELRANLVEGVRSGAIPPPVAARRFVDALLGSDNGA